MSAKHAVTMEGVSVRWGAVEALRDVSFSLPAGAFLAIIGPNGAGKSTLLNVLMGLQRPTLGRATILGTNPEAAPLENIGFIPQVKTLDTQFPAPAVDLVVTGVRRGWPWRIRPAERTAALEALAQAGAAHLADRQVSRLSGGELQRVYLARCLIRKPALLMLDEPAAGLDMAGEAAMHHLLEEYRRASGATILMITHDWEGARTHASHVLLMAKGLAAFGDPAQVASEARLLDVFGYTGHRRLSREERH